MPLAVLCPYKPPFSLPLSLSSPIFLLTLLAIFFFDAAKFAERKKGNSEATLPSPSPLPPLGPTNCSSKSALPPPLPQSQPHQSARSLLFPRVHSKGGRPKARWMERTRKEGGRGGRKRCPERSPSLSIPSDLARSSENAKGKDFFSPLFLRPSPLLLIQTRDITKRPFPFYPLPRSVWLAAWSVVPAWAIRERERDRYCNFD